MKILVVGLGLIGASVAKALKKYTDNYIMGYNRTKSVSARALSDGVIDETGELSVLLPKADLTIVNYYAEAIVPFIKENKDLFKKNSIVIDTCGIKTKICRALQNENFDFTFIGAHPMAGKEVSGYDNSTADLFIGASFICTPTEEHKEEVELLFALAKKMQFAKTVVTTPEHHDEMIAFTSQIAHVLACSYVSSPLAPMHADFSAGSYRDVSRVARINGTMWSELFIDNKEPLVREIDDLTKNLNLFKMAIINEDRDELMRLMAIANKIKEEIG